MRNTPKGSIGPERSSAQNAFTYNPPGRSANLTYRIVEELGVAIVTGRYSATNPFPVEADLCTQFGVSRSILREAVKMLTAKGLLGARPRQGTWVQPERNWNLLDPDVLRWLLERKLSLSLLVEFTEMRLAVEPVAARIAAEKATAEDIRTIYGTIDRMSAAEKGLDDSLSADIGFHVSVMRASGNRFYFQLCGLINTALHFSIRTTNAYKGVERASVVDHRRVADAIAERKPDAAEAGMRGMMVEALELIRSGAENSVSAE